MRVPFRFNLGVGDDDDLRRSMGATAFYQHNCGQSSAIERSLVAPQISADAIHIDITFRRAGAYFDVL